MTHVDALAALLLYLIAAALGIFVVGPIVTAICLALFGGWLTFWYWFEQHAILRWRR